MMTLKEVMTRKIQTISPEATLEEAAHIMRETGIGVLPVFDGIHIYGIVTDRDITVRSTSEGMNPRVSQVQEVMSREVVTCPAGYEIEEAVKLMIQEQIMRLVVTDTNMMPVGIVSLGDIALYAEKKRLAARVIQSISAERHEGRAR